jgi:NifU-like protein involved in Fe-S cluster formation
VEQQQEPSDAFLEHAMTPQHLGVLPDPAVSALARGTCGDVIELYLRVEQGRIEAVRFMPQGCVHTVACGSALTSLVSGQTLEAAAEINPDMVEEALGGLSREHRHCAALAVAALRLALRRHHENERSPWKRLYARS